MTVLGIKISLPWAPSVFASVVGFLLIVVVLSLARGGEPPESRPQLSLIPSASAQETAKSAIPQGWVYFGYEGSPKQWNFEIVGGGYAELKGGKPGVLLKSLRTVPVREQHYGSFTGTVLGVINPEPKKLGALPKGDCAMPKAVASVGINKIWVQVVPTPCPK
jgi:hypothetical protein